MPTPPNLAAAKAYLGTSVNFTDAQIQAALDAEKSAQSRACKVSDAPFPDYPFDLIEALLRRVARNLAMRNLPLGVQADDAGGIRIGSTDPEVRRLEGPYRRRVVA